MKITHVLIVLAISITVAACQRKKVDTFIKSVPVVRTVHPHTGKINDTLAASGVITTIDQSDLSFQDRWNCGTGIYRGGRLYT
jgi:uncharacterized lipoprotein YbaY